MSETIKEKAGEATEQVTSNGNGDRAKKLLIPAAAGVGVPSVPYAAATGGPVTSSSRSVWRSAIFAMRPVSRRGVLTVEKVVVVINSQYVINPLNCSEQLEGAACWELTHAWLGGLDLKDGRFITRVWSNDVNTQFNPFVSLVNRIQYDTVTRQLGWQARFHWIMTPGNDVFLVYSHNWIDQASFHTLDRKGSIKVVKTVLF